MWRAWSGLGRGGRELGLGFSVPRYPQALSGWNSMLILTERLRATGGRIMW